MTQLFELRHASTAHGAPVAQAPQPCVQQWQASAWIPLGWKPSQLGLRPKHFDAAQTGKSSPESPAVMQLQLGHCWIEVETTALSYSQAAAEAHHAFAPTHQLHAEGRRAQP